MRGMILLGVCLAFPASLLAADAVAVKPAGTPAQIEFFEKKIRPVLAEHCYSCHSAGAKQLKGNLLLDTREATRKGGDTGPSVVPGNLEESLIIDALKWEGGLQMPPAGKLPAAVIADFSKWVADGAVDPRDKSESGRKTVMDFARAESHWSFKRLAAPKIPEVKQRDWPVNPIDRFILSRLESAGLTPSPSADRRTLLRRAYIDLIGLPPTYVEIETFVQDKSPEAFEKAIDRLLASPHYGERWGRHWLDIARYADTKDAVLLYGKDRLRPYAYTYRDYVIRALNADTPYDQFLKEQVAADQLQPAVEKWRLAAMGFLTLGRQFDENFPDVVDDRIDTLFRGTQALTVACARCHDHKYDPIPSADYYSLYGVFANCGVPLDLPLLADASKSPEAEDFEKKTSTVRKELNDFVDQQYAMLQDDFCRRIGDYLLKVTQKPDPLENAVFILVLRHIDMRLPVIAQWRNYLAKKTDERHPVWGPWHELLDIPEADLSSRAPAIIAKWRSAPAGLQPGQINPLIQTALAETSIHTRADVARLYGDVFRRTYLAVKGPHPLLDDYVARQERERAEAKKKAADEKAAKDKASRKVQTPQKSEEKKLVPTPGVQPQPESAAVKEATKPVIEVAVAPAPLTSAKKSRPAFTPVVPGPAERQLLDILTGEDGPHFMSRGQTHYYLDKLVLKLDKLAIHAEPAPPPRGMVLADFPRITEPRILVRGIATQPGDPVKRQFLRVLSGSHRQTFKTGSGRLELANAIADPHNPLTARVIVNRVWQEHFGEPLVSTPSDFGMRSSPPTHPELLDWLAATFQREGWSLKKLHRLMLLSRTWQQASTDRPECRRVDSENRLWWRMQRRRLDLESMRDGLLAVSGRLDLNIYGRPEEGMRNAGARRRTIYGVVDRQDVPAAYRAFDFANPDSSVERRPSTTVPQQALFGMNSQFFSRQARSLAGRPEVAQTLDLRARVAALHAAVYSRLPTADEIETGLQFVAAVERDPPFELKQSRTSATGQLAKKRNESYEAPDPTATAVEKPLTPWEQYAQVLLLTNEFMFVD